MAISNNKFVHEVVDMAAAAKTRKEKIELLRKYESWALKDILRGSFDEVVQWNLPGGKVPYEPAEARSAPNTLSRQHKQFRYFVKGGPGDQMPAIKRETMFVRLVESIHPRDAELVCSMINKKAPAQGITKKLVQEAFPDLIKK